MLSRLLSAIIPNEVVMAMSEVDVIFVEYSCPLERRTWLVVSNSHQGLLVRKISCLTMKSLARGTMAIF